MPVTQFNEQTRYGIVEKGQWAITSHKSADVDIAGIPAPDIFSVVVPT